MRLYPYNVSMMPYEKLLAWKVAHELALKTYHVTDSWPKNELYGLTAQIRRAALSVPTNIAEGVAKSGPREFRRYLDISLGSLSELSYLLLFGRDRGLLSLGEWERLNSKRDRLGQLLWRLYRSIQQRARELN
jgi:four helix bundle protein